MDDLMEALAKVKTGLTAFKKFLLEDMDDSVKDAVKQAAAKFPVINTVIGKLIELIDALDTKITELDPNNSLEQVPSFLSAVSDMLEAAENMIPTPPELEEAIEAASGIAEVLEEIRTTIPLIKTALEELKAP